MKTDIMECVRESEKCENERRESEKSESERRESEAGFFRQPEKDAGEDGWKEVRHRHRKQPPNTTSFFVYNLPATITSQELKTLFHNHGNLSDAYIAKKKDKYDNPFGFIRFKNVTNVQSFLSRLQNIRHEGLIISVTPAKNDKRGNPIPQTKPYPSHKTLNHPSWNQPQPPPFRYNQPPPPAHNTQLPQPPPYNYIRPPFSTSFRDTITNPPPTPPLTINLTKSNPKTPNVWKKTSIIATLRYFQTLPNPTLLTQNPDWNPEIALSYVGGLTLLLTFNASQLAKDFFYAKRAFLQKWCSSFDIWNGQETRVGRVAKIKINGLPLHLWDKANFDKIAASLGKILVGSTDNYHSNNLSSSTATLLVTSQKKMDCDARIVHGPNTYDIRITEFDYGWCPTLSLVSPTCSSENDSGKTQPENSSPTGMEYETSKCLEKDDPMETLNDNAINESTTPNAHSPQKKPSHSPKKTPPPKPNNQPINDHLESRANNSPPMHVNPLPTPTPNQTCLTPIPPLTKSRKRQRRFSPNSIEGSQLDLNSPPPSFGLHNGFDRLDHNTAPTIINKYSDFMSRTTFAPIPFETLLNQERQEPSQTYLELQDTHIPTHADTTSTLNQPSQLRPLPLNPPPTRTAPQT